MNKSKKPLVNASAREAVHDQRTEMVRAQVQRESAELDARTIRLKALRLEKEAQEALDAANAPPPPPKKPARKPASVPKPAK
jgi:hypothetical protein